MRLNLATFHSNLSMKACTLQVEIIVRRGASADN